MLQIIKPILQDRQDRLQQQNSIHSRTRSLLPGLEHEQQQQINQQIPINSSINKFESSLQVSTKSARFTLSKTSSTNNLMINSPSMTSKSTTKAALFKDKRLLPLRRDSNRLSTQCIQPLSSGYNKKKKKFTQNQNTHIDYRWGEILPQNNYISDRSKHTAVVYKDYMYVFGGYEINKGGIGEMYRICLSSITKRTFNVFQWEKVHQRGDVPGMIYSHVAVQHGKYMFIYGGILSNHKYTDRLYRCNLQNGTWTLLEGSVEVQHIQTEKENDEMPIASDVFNFYFDDINNEQKVGNEKNNDMSEENSAKDDDLQDKDLDNDEEDDEHHQHQDVLKGQLYQKLHKKTTQFPWYLESHAACEYKGSMLVFGGYCGNSPHVGCYSNALLKYDFQTKDQSKANWQILSDFHFQHHNLPVGRVSTSCCVLRDCLYIYGGLHQSQILDDFWEFNIAQKVWTWIDCGQFGPGKREAPSLNALTNSKYLLLFGGLDDTMHCNNAIFSYNVEDKAAPWIDLSQSLQLQQPQQQINSTQQQQSVANQYPMQIKTPQQTENEALKVLPSNTSVIQFLNTTYKNMQNNSDHQKYLKGKGHVTYKASLSGQHLDLSPIQRQRFIAKKVNNFNYSFSKTHKNSAEYLDHSLTQSFSSQMLPKVFSRFQTNLQLPIKLNLNLNQLSQQQHNQHSVFSGLFTSRSFHHRALPFSSIQNQLLSNCRPKEDLLESYKEYSRGKAFRAELKKKMGSAKQSTVQHLKKQHWESEKRSVLYSLEHGDDITTASQKQQQKIQKIQQIQRVVHSPLTNQMNFINELVQQKINQKQSITQSKTQFQQDKQLVQHDRKQAIEQFIKEVKNNSGFKKVNSILIGKAPCSRDDFSTAVYGNYLVFFGGERNQAQFNDIYYLDTNMVLLQTKGGQAQNAEQEDQMKLRKE